MSETKPPERVAARIDSVLPDVASAEGGTHHLIQGAGFDATCRIVISGVSVETQFVDGYSLRFVAPPMPEGVTELSVLHGDVVSAAAQVRFRRPPRIEGAEPAESSQPGGITVVLRGSGFESGCTLAFNTERAVTVDFIDAETLIFVVPPLLGGQREIDLLVTNPSGLFGRAAGLFCYRDAQATLFAIEPRTGWIQGGKLVCLRGLAFHPQVRVRFGDVVAEVHSVGPDRLEVVVPPRDRPGEVEVWVENPDQEPSRLPDTFIYELVSAPPKLTHIKPNLGSCRGGETIRIHGENFTPSTRVRIADVTALIRNATTSYLDVETPSRTLGGAVAIELEDTGVCVRSEEVFRYVSEQAMSIHSLTPTRGSSVGGSSVTIEGQHFPQAVSVRFGSETSRRVVVNSASEIVCVVPAQSRAHVGGTQTVDVTIEAGMSKVTRKAAFQYEPAAPPVIRSVDPRRIAARGGTVVEIEGNNFVDGVVVLFGTRVALDVKRKSPLVLEAVSPSGPHGQLVDVVVRNPDGQMATERRAVQFDDKS